MKYIGISVVVLIVVLYLVISYLWDKKKWNGGISPYDWEPWKGYDTDSGGERGYKDKSGNGIWIFWPVDKRED